MNDDIRESSRDHCTIATIRCYASHNLATEKDANARLIAAAPELLDALEMAEIPLAIIVSSGSPSFSQSSHDGHKQVLQMVRAAIAKAKGE